MLESRFQADLKKELEYRFPGCIVLKNDSSYLQGVPDLIVLWHDRWAMLECKRSATARERPNQRWYVDMLDEMSFAAFVYPENMDEVLDEIQRQFETRRKARVPKR